jgi:mycothiol system anti-sigma-R factor
MISCAQAVNQLWGYLDQTVEPADRALIEAHLARCRRCCGEFEFATELRRILAEAGQVDVPEAVRRRLHQTLEELGP